MMKLFLNKYRIKWVFALYFFLASFVLVLHSNVVPGIITYSIDDGHHSAYDIAFPVISYYGEVATINVISSYIGNEQWLNRQQLLEMQSKGWEVCSHSMTHPHFSKIPLTYSDEVVNNWSAICNMEHVFVASSEYREVPFVLENGFQLLKVNNLYQVEATPGSFFFDSSNYKLFIHTMSGSLPEPNTIRIDSVQRELEYSKSTLNGLGLKVNNFVVPYHDWDEQKETVGKMYYVSVSDGPQHRWINTLPLANKFNLVRLVVASDTSVAGLKWWINKAIKENCWIILCFHYFGEDDGLNASYWSREKLEELVSWVDQHDIRVVTQQQGIESSDKMLKSMDCDTDCDIDGQDLSLLAKSFGSSVGSSGYIEGLDLNQDGKIGKVDVITFARGYGSCISSCK